MAYFTERGPPVRITDVVSSYFESKLKGEAMIQLKGAEPDSADAVQMNPRSQLFIFAEENRELKPGDEVLVLIRKRPEQEREDYGIPLRITDSEEPGENEIVVQYGDRLFVAQKMPEFI